MTPQPNTLHAADDQSPNQRASRLTPVAFTVAALGIDLAILFLSALGTAAVLAPNGAHVLPSAAFAGLMAASMLSLGVYTGIRERPRTSAIRLLAALVIGLFATVVYSRIATTVSLPRDAVPLATVVAYVLITLRRGIFAKAWTYPPRRVLSVGAVNVAMYIATRMRRRADRERITMVGHVLYQSSAAPEAIRDKVVTPRGSLLDFACENRIDEIILDGQGETLYPLDDLLRTKLSGVRFVSPDLFFEEQLGRVEIDPLRQSEWLYVEPPAETYLLSKRVFDVCVSGLMVFILLPLLALTAIAIRIESAGPVLYRQERVGLNGRTFNVLKFRTMSSGGDNQMTKVGRMLRELRIDELPQLINVLAGDMSLVGPRPERVDFVERISRAMPLYGQRYSVKPGITGWSQLSYPHGSSERDAVEKLKYDLYYLKHASVIFDLAILLQTTEVVIWGIRSR